MPCSPSSHPHCYYQTSIKGKKELKEIEEEGRNKIVELNISEPNNQALVVSTRKRNDERQGNASPIMSPKA